ncbi:MAG: DUF4199 domain-containing protein [Paludibacteraceae bacterium]|nr:DUF4199 domain-containing protein [Paludibacteraceae bacterium]
MLLNRNVTRMAMTQAVSLGVYLAVKFYLSLSPYTSFIALLMTVFVPLFVLVLQKRACTVVEEDTRITYWFAFRYGVALFFYATVLLAFSQFVYFKYINPSYLQGVYAETMTVLEPYVTPEMMAELKTNGGFSAMQMMFSSLALNSFCGVLISLFTSAVMMAGRR